MSAPAKSLVLYISSTPHERDQWALKVLSATPESFKRQFGVAKATDPRAQTPYLVNVAAGSTLPASKTMEYLDGVRLKMSGGGGGAAAGAASVQSRVDSTAAARQALLQGTRTSGGGGAGGPAGVVSGGGAGGPVVGADPSGPKAFGGFGGAGSVAGLGGFGRTPRGMDLSGSGPPSLNPEDAKQLAENKALRERVHKQALDGLFTSFGMTPAASRSGAEEIVPFKDSKDAVDVDALLAERARSEELIKMTQHREDTKIEAISEKHGAGIDSRVGIGAPPF